MPTFNQVVRGARNQELRPYNRSPKMEGCPQKMGICLKVGTTKPKKPNSAVRKIAKVRLPTGHNVRAVIPGAGFDLMEHNTVLLRAGRVRDIPGVHYRLIRNKYDLGPPHGFQRQNRRSKFGVVNWVYLIRTPTGEPLQVVSSLRSRRQMAQSEWGLPLTWERGKFKLNPRAIPEPK
jgi:small subunit ribosomal protein S12